jgi:hypothetical protein
MTNYDYMTQNNSIEEPNPWEESPFRKIDRLIGQPDNKTSRALKNAKKIRSAVLRDGELMEDSAAVDGMATDLSAQTPKFAYYIYAAPVADAAEDVHWRHAFRLSLDEAPEFNSDEFKEAASTLTIPDTDNGDKIARKVARMYSHLREVTADNDGQRAVSPWELKGEGPVLQDRHEERALRYLSDFPGVTAPARDGPAWVEATEETDTDGSEEYEASEDTRRNRTELAES